MAFIEPHPQAVGPHPRSDDKRRTKKEYVAVQSEPSRDGDPSAGGTPSVTANRTIGEDVW